MFVNIPKYPLCEHTAFKKQVVLSLIWILGRILSQVKQADLGITPGKCFRHKRSGSRLPPHRAFPASDPSFFWRSLSAIFHSHPPSHLSVTWKMPHFAQTQFQRFHFYQRVPISAFISIRYLFTFKVTAKKFKDRRLIQCLNLSTAKSRS